MGLLKENHLTTDIKDVNDALPSTWRVRIATRVSLLASGPEQHGGTVFRAALEE